MNGNGNVHSRPSVGRLMNDLFDLLELQWELSRLSVREAMGACVSMAVLAATSIVLALAGVITLVFSGAYWIHSAWDWSLWSSLLLMTGIALVMAGGAALLAWSRARRVMWTVGLAGRELRENVRAVREILTASEPMHEPYPFDTRGTSRLNDRFMN